MTRGAALEAFLREMDARMLWEFTLTTSRVEGYIAKSRIFIVHLYGINLDWREADGWEIFIPATEKNDIGVTLDCVREYLEKGRP
jgi:hypothetical protein